MSTDVNSKDAEEWSDLMRRNSDMENEIARLRDMLNLFAERLEKQAFDIPPPNRHTPDMVLLAQQMRGAAITYHYPAREAVHESAVIPDSALEGS